MLIGNFYYEIPTSFPELNATSLYYVAFAFLAFCLARPFKSLLRPYVLCIFNIAFLYSFGIEALIVASAVALVGYISGLVLRKFYNVYLCYGFVAVEILILAIFKYQFVSNLIVPIGLSFYTFKNISYTVDCYRDFTITQYNPLKYYAYACFFPCITAGPINRSEEFFTELDKREEFEYVDAKNGGIQMLLGIFEKIVISDYLALVANNILDNPEIVGWNVLFGILLYSFVIYLDFDACSNIAIGTARLFGIHLTKNFNSPYLGHNLKDFWGRWHISLTSWLKDYVYIPLGGNRKGKIRSYINILIVFLVSGIWHGSTWNFVLWGLLNGLIRIAEDYIEKKAEPYIHNEITLKVLPYFGIVLNFFIVSFLWLVFRYQNLAEVGDVVSRLFVSGSLDLTVIGITANEILWLKILLVVVVVLDILRNNIDMLELLANQFILYRWIFYTLLIVVILIFGVYGGSYDPSDFIYKWF